MKKKLPRAHKSKATADTQVQDYRVRTSPRIPRAHKSKATAYTQVQGYRARKSKATACTQIQGYRVALTKWLGCRCIGFFFFFFFFIHLYHSYSFMIHPWIQSHGDHPHVGENPPYMSGGGEDHSSTKIRRNFYLNLGVFLWRGGLRFLFVDHFSKKKKKKQ